MMSERNILKVQRGFRVMLDLREISNQFCESVNNFKIDFYKERHQKNLLDPITEYRNDRENRKEIGDNLMLYWKFTNKKKLATLQKCKNIWVKIESDKLKCKTYEYSMDLLKQTTLFNEFNDGLKGDVSSSKSKLDDENENKFDQIQHPDKYKKTKTFSNKMPKNEIKNETNNQELINIQPTSEKQDNGKIKLTLTINTEESCSIFTINLNENLLFVGMISGRIQVYNYKTGGLETTFPHCQNVCIRSMFYLKDKNLLISGDNIGTIFIYRDNRGRELVKNSFPIEQIF